MLTLAQVEATVAAIAATQEGTGRIPWVPAGKTDPWNLVEAAMALGLAGRAIADASASTRGRRLADGVALACLVQLGVGALNVFLLAPVWMQLLHLAMADAIWIGATWMILECLANDTLPGTLHAEPST